MTIPPPSNQPQNRGAAPLFRGTFFNLEIVVLVAFLLATFFSAWTPDSNTPALEQGIVDAANPTSVNAISQQEQSLPVTTLQPSENTPAAEANPELGIVVGHWGDQNDPGAVCADGQLTEFKINQDIATLVEKDLTQKGYRVTLLKEFDARLSGFKALALVSIHADSCDYINDQATGYKVAAAMGKQNQDKSTRLAACLRSRYAEATGLNLHSMSITQDMTSYHAFSEVESDTPAVIIETGFLNLDRQFLTEHPDVAATGIVNGILCFLNNESVSSTPLQPTP
jgi:N-acetylmuramoyl-L-alanine amidase